MKGKIILVTGSTSGIGRATGQELLNQGATVIISSNLDLPQEDVLKGFDFAGQSVYLQCDISSESDVKNISKIISERFGRLDGLVCNAGVILRPCGIEDITEEVIDKTIAVNLKGTFFCLRHLGKLIQETGSNGSIVCLTSVDGIIGEPYAVIYSATKAGIISMTKSFARHYKNPLVRVNAIAPGLIDTPLTASTGEDPINTTSLSVIERMGQPVEIAKSIAFLLSEESSFTTGQVLAVDGGFTLK